MPPIASTPQAQSAGLFREALRCFVWKRQGGGGVAPTPTPAKVAKHRLRARVNTVLIEKDTRVPTRLFTMVKTRRLPW